MERKTGKLPEVITFAVNTFLELGPEAQEVALPLITEATIQRGRFFNEGPYSTQAEGTALENRWKDYLRTITDTFAQTIDPTYWPGHGANLTELDRQRILFLNIFNNLDGTTLLQTLDQIEWLLQK
ncbi:hypothetical protein A2Z33_02615 [Candidatus Gottesmanbacteria bacterium RBG_16_52_11]|uniref:Uncharacterized protein n=1 Tax=Candidatus Gottesmanbacteria bacterium RBG_16_52_11 TaxID=1798374 RepID=A0A1F5YMI1_9BACT|nr:MAG: hypothetical protein A2Z33_02615 [Candidatus Gottesmanbacteria bacterium RBG_16_52_11]